MMKLTAADGHEFDAYEVHPPSATAAIVVIQEIFGANAHIRAVVDGFAARGYRAIAPALFDRVERGVELDYTGDGVARGRDLRAGLDWDDSMLDVAAAVSNVAPTGAVGVVGYCYGGSIAWLAASMLPVQAAVGYYGGQIHDFRDRAPQAPTMLHFGGLDQMIPRDGIDEVAALHPEVAVHVYDDADHGFNCDARASYHEASATLALDRTLAFFRSHGVA
jgi:carboxymethylenebutenolidase